jgi:hypothetical protein
VPEWRVFYFCAATEIFQMLVYVAALFVISFVDAFEQNCTIRDVTYQHGSYFLHQVHFNATCVNGQIKVVNCLTQRGTQIPIGTLLFFEDGNASNCKQNILPHLGFNYTCKDSVKAGNAPKVLEDGDEKLAEECEAGDTHFVREGFVVSNLQILNSNILFRFHVNRLNYLDVPTLTEIWYVRAYLLRKLALCVLVLSTKTSVE